MGLKRGDAAEDAVQSFSARNDVISLERTSDVCAPLRWLRQIVAATWWPDDKYLPSLLIRGQSEDLMFHAQIATDLTGNNVRIVTMYLPEPDERDASLRTRRTRL